MWSSMVFEKTGSVMVGGPRGRTKMETGGKLPHTSGT